MNEKERVEYVEKVGVFFEQNGFPPMVGRVIGYLMTSNEKGRTFYEIHQFVNASKSSVSTALNKLVEKKLVRYLTISGDRKRYFFLDLKPWIGQTKERAEFFSSFAVLITQCVAIRDDKESAFTQDLVRLESFYKYMAAEMPKIIDRWEKMHS
jgi:DNA-binding transcriptional regulator GbsR (MarR family)